MRRIIVTAMVLLPLLLGSHERAHNDHAVVRWGADLLAYHRQQTIPGGTEQLPKVGVIVNLNEGTVSFLGYVAHINSADAAYVQFGGKGIGVQFEGAKINIMGEIDRVTGRMEATFGTECVIRHRAVGRCFDVLARGARVQSLIRHMSDLFAKSCSTLVGAKSPQCSLHWNPTASLASE
jgi:hypothetical protein